MAIEAPKQPKILALDLQHCKLSRVTVAVVSLSAFEDVLYRCGICDEHYRLYTDAAASQLQLLLSPPMCPAPLQVTCPVPLRDSMPSSSALSLWYL